MAKSIKELTAELEASQARVTELESQLERFSAQLAEEEKAKNTMIKMSKGKAPHAREIEAPLEDVPTMEKNGWKRA